MKVSKYGVFSGPYFAVFGLNIQSKNRRIRTRKNSIFQQFSRSIGVDRDIYFIEDIFFGLLGLGRGIFWVGGDEKTSFIGG